MRGNEGFRLLNKTEEDFPALSKADEPSVRRAEAEEHADAVIEESLMDMRGTDVEVPAPRKRMSGEEKLRSWLTEGVKVAAPPKQQQQLGLLNGFASAANPAGLILLYA